MENDQHDMLFEVQTPLGFRVRVTHAYWELISTIKHPVMAGREDIVKDVLKNPREIRVSKRDEAVLLFYQSERVGRWVCAVTKKLNGTAF